MEGKGFRSFQCFKFIFNITFNVKACKVLFVVIVTLLRNYILKQIPGIWVTETWCTCVYSVFTPRIAYPLLISSNFRSAPGSGLFHATGP